MVLTVIGKKNSRKLLQGIKEKFVEITEGSTKILVLDKSINDKVPPKKPVFFNPAAKLNRDFSILAYSAFWNDFDKPKIFLDGLAGVGARSLRVANEIKNVEKVVINDVNSDALDVAQKSAKLNNISNFETSENETCRFFSLFSQKDNNPEDVRGPLYVFTFFPCESSKRIAGNPVTPYFFTSAGSSLRSTERVLIPVLFCDTNDCHSGISFTQ